ncbi:MAG: DNA polymerase Y family protein [Actinomycetota bacterium]|nr:DNA polymerase Y family protein [Actinomycetota bacterium]
MLLWCPDWPVIAAEIVLGVPSAGPVVVLHGNRVIACSEAARQEGVRRGLRRREAQSRCPQVEAVEHDPGRDARAFEPVVAAVEEVAAGVEVIRPGACAVAARGPSRYFGGEETAAERIVEQVAESCAVESQVGIAEGVFAAGLAARAGRVIAPGGTADFLRGQPIEALERPELTDLLKRLGLKTLGEFAALPAGDVLTRFGFDGALAHRLAAGFDHRPLAVRRPPPDLEVSETYDEPLERVDVAAFAGRALAERLHDKLAAYGLACTRLGIEAVTANGQELHRVWRHDGTLTSAAIAERVRWQLDGWLIGARRGAPARPTAGLVRLRLIPDGVLVHLGLQPGLWGDAGAGRERAHRAFSRVQGLLGPESVVTPVLGGGRNADDQIRLVPWGDERDPHRPAAPHTDPVPGITTVPVLSRHTQPELTLHLPDPPSPVRDDPAPEAGEFPWPPVEGAEFTTRSLLVGAAGRPVLGLVPGGRQGDGQGTETPARAAGSEKPGGMEERKAAQRAEAKAGKGRKKVRKEPPWPGRVPRPAPAIVLGRGVPAVVLDRDGEAVGVSARLDLTGSPAALIVERARPVAITGWAGPWPVDERWWDAEQARRRARFQVLLSDGRAFLLSLSGGHWAVEAIYD